MEFGKWNNILMSWILVEAFGCFFGEVFGCSSLQMMMIDVLDDDDDDDFDDDDYDDFYDYDDYDD